MLGIQYFLVKPRLNRSLIISFSVFAMALLRTVSAQTIDVPVVVHIVSNDPDAITDEDVEKGIKDLNEAFSHTGLYGTLGPGYNTGIRFCLVKKDPLGGNTTGITRTKSVLGDFDRDIEDRRMKELVSWDTRLYCNIWLVDGLKTEILPQYKCGQWERLTENGYATFSPDGDFRDGVVIKTFGRTLAHNMGHYLGLLHTFTLNECENGNCNSDGDGICDTPPSSIASGDCGSGINTCKDNPAGGVDLPDMLQNFMTYDPCTYMFTQGQAQKMRDVLTNARKSLLWQDRCLPACSRENVLAQFTRSDWFPTPGSSVTFTANSRTVGTNYEWYVDGVRVPSATGRSLTHTFSDVDKYAVSLKTYNGDPACFGSQIDSVIVTCGVMARFVPNKRVIASKDPIMLDTILFENRSVNGASFKWLMGEFPDYIEKEISTSRDLEYIFKDSGSYRIRLVAQNGSCTDTTEYFNFKVEDPTVDGLVSVISVNCLQDTKIELEFAICNKGYAAIPPNTPVAFYDGDPRLPGAQKIGQSYVMTDTLKGRCCSPDIRFQLDVGRKGVTKVYAVFNDKGNPVPFTLSESNTLFPEFNYDNNFTLFTSSLFSIDVDPKSAALAPGDVLPLTATVSPDVTSFQWQPSPGLSCTNCLTPDYTAGTAGEKLLFKAENGKGCKDEVEVDITIPPWNDYTVALDPPECLDAAKDRVVFRLCNQFARGGVVPAGLKVSFYDGDPRSGSPRLLGPAFTVGTATAAQCGSFTHDIEKSTTGIVFAVVNDKGDVPWVLPADPLLPEKDYTNNLASAAPLPFSVDVNPKSATMEPGETLNLAAVVSSGVTTHGWQPSPGLSCTNCLTPTYTAGTADETLVFFGENVPGCKSTVNVPISIPPWNDYTVQVKDLTCFRNTRLTVDFSLCNLFARGGVVPAGLKVAFYDGDPRIGTPKRLDPVFTVPAATPAGCGDFTHVIDATTTGTVFAVVNDDGGVPWVLPAGMLLEEKDYANNVASRPYTPQSLDVTPKSATILLNTTVRIQVTSILPASTTIDWLPDPGYTLSCLTGCLTNDVSVLSKSVLKVRATDLNGCTKVAQVDLDILPPDLRVEVVSSVCFSPTQTQVNFTVHMGNGYNTVFKGIPVVFYDGDPTTGAAAAVQTFLTPADVTGAGSASYSVLVPTPASGVLYMRVNQSPGMPVPSHVFPETDFANNQVSVATVPFRVRILPGDTTVTRLTNLRFTAETVSGSVSSYNWQSTATLSCLNCPNPVLIVPYKTTVILNAQNQFSCTARDTTVVESYTDGKYHIPNAFTPNGDGLNDVFYVMGSREIRRLAEFSVYDRYGKLVFQALDAKPNDPRFGWRGDRAGRPVPSGTFVYTLTLEYVDNTREFVKGLVTVIR